MKSLNQPHKLPVTGHHDRPMRLNVDDYIQPLTEPLLPTMGKKRRRHSPCLHFLPSLSSLLTPVFSTFGSLLFLVPAAEVITLTVLWKITTEWAPRTAVRAQLANTFRAKKGVLWRILKLNLNALVGSFFYFFGARVLCHSFVPLIFSAG